jgi:hypothetical protein
LNNWGTDEAQEERFESTKMTMEQRQHPRDQTRELDNKTLQLKSFDERCTTLIASLEARQHDVDSGGDGTPCPAGFNRIRNMKKERRLEATAKTSGKMTAMSTLTQEKALAPIVEAEFGTFSQAQQFQDANASWNSRTATEVEYCRTCAMPPGKPGEAYCASLPESCKGRVAKGSLFLIRNKSLVILLGSFFFNINKQSGYSRCRQHLPTATHTLERNTQRRQSTTRSTHPALVRPQNKLFDNDETGIKEYVAREKLGDGDGNWVSEPDHQL